MSTNPGTSNSNPHHITAPPGLGSVTDHSSDEKVTPHQLARFVIDTFQPASIPNLMFQHKQVTQLMIKNSQIYSLFSNLHQAVYVRLEEINSVLKPSEKFQNSRILTGDENDIKRLHDEISKLKKDSQEKELQIAALKVRATESDERFENVRLK